MSQNQFHNQGASSGVICRFLILANPAAEDLLNPLVPDLAGVERREDGGEQGIMSHDLHRDRRRDRGGQDSANPQAWRAVGGAHFLRAIRRKPFSEQLYSVQIGKSAVCVPMSGELVLRMH